MDRLTFWESGKPCYKDMRHDPLSGENAEVVICGGPIATKLAAYEDAEQQGRLVVLPCKVGDAVYQVQHHDITPVTVPDLHTVARWIEDDVFGEHLFLTREEAEKALEGMK